MALDWIRFGGSLRIRCRLGGNGFGRGYGGLGLLEFRLQIRIVQTDQHVARFYFLAGFEIDFGDARQQLGTDARFMHGANRAHRRFGERQSDQTHWLHASFDRQLRGLDFRGACRHFRLKLTRQP